MKIYILINKIKTYIAQLGFLGAFGFFLLELVRRICEPHSKLSYAQVGEDMVLNWFFSANEGFYVEVGCNQAKAYSNSYNLYKKGWKGICIDANENLIFEHKHFRKKDISIYAAISNVEQELKFVEFFDSLVSSLDIKHVAKYKEIRPIKSERMLTTRTLDSVLDEFNAPNKFDFLSIDVEGHDYEVLLSINLNRYRPKLILIEIHEFDISNPNPNKIYNYLISMNYKMVGYIIMNGYFIDNT